MACTTIGPAFWHKLLSAKTHTAITAVTSLNKNRRTIYKLHSHTCLLNNLSTLPTFRNNHLTTDNIMASHSLKSSGTPSIEELILRLEEITRNIENPETGLENSIGLYEEGLSIAETCKNRLQEARKKIEVINPELAKTLPETLRTKDLFDSES
jgi:exodeoxyribonuclease VII small subunit